MKTNCKPRLVSHSDRAFIRNLQDNGCFCQVYEHGRDIFFWPPGVFLTSTPDPVVNLFIRRTRKFSGEKETTIRRLVPLKKVSALIAEFRISAAFNNVGHAVLCPLKSDRKFQQVKDFTYFISAAGTGLVKIGRTQNIAKRLLALKAGSPAPLELVAICSGSRWPEPDLHQRFHRLRVHGEWFRFTDEIRSFLESEAAPPYPHKLATPTEATA